VRFSLPRRAALWCAQFDCRAAAGRHREANTLVIIGAALGLLAAPFAALADDVPDALSVEWQGKKLCEKLYEDAQIRVARCTFPPGAVHVCHSHPSYFSYTVSGGRGQVQDRKGTRSVDVVAGAYIDIPPVPWHEFTNIGDTTLQYIVVEKKYQPPSIADQSSCPKK
jgi:quercetin dioxygenase-like cupin family protein